MSSGDDEVSPELEAVAFFASEMMRYRKNNRWKNGALDEILKAIRHRSSGLYSLEVRTAREYEQLVRIAVVYLDQNPRKTRKNELWYLVAHNLLEFIDKQPWTQKKLETDARLTITQIFGRCLNMIRAGKA